MLFSVYLAGQSYTSNNIANAGNHDSNTDFAVNKLNNQQKSDSIYLFIRKTQYVLENDEYVMKWPFYIEYHQDPENPGYAQYKRWVNLTAYTYDSINQFLINYDEPGRVAEERFQQYDTVTDKWLNESLAESYYDIWGYDSLTRVKNWNEEIQAFENYQEYYTYRDEVRSITHMATRQWNGYEWENIMGDKYEYFRNTLKCIDTIYRYYWNTAISDWDLYQKSFLFYDDDDVFIGATEIRINNENHQWENLQRTLEFEYNDWCECDKWWNCELKPTHFILQNWYDTAWFNINKGYGTYDSLGGEEFYQDLFNYTTNEWVKWSFLDTKFIEENVLDYQLRSVWKNNSWVGDNGVDQTFYYENGLVSELKTDIWDTTINNWAPQWKTLYLDYIALPSLNAGTGKHHVDKNKFFVIPNPAKGDVTIKTAQEAEKILSVEIVDITGVAVFKKNEFNHANNRLTINIENLEKGVYVVKAITSDKNVYSAKLIKE